MFYFQRPYSNRKGKFDPNDEKTVKHTHLGKVWELYEERQPELAKVPFSSWLNLERYTALYDSLPYVWRMLKDIGSIRACWFYFGLYLAISFSGSLIPAVQLWYSGQLLKIVGVAVEQRTVDKHLLFKIAVGRIISSVAALAVHHLTMVVSSPLNVRIKRHYSIRMFGVLARLDVPTFDDPLVQRQIEQAFPANERQSLIWRTIVSSTGIGSSVVMLVSQLSVLFNVLKDQPDGPLLALLSLSYSLFSMRSLDDSIFTRIWAATTNNQDYIKLSGLRKAATEPAHRKEIVAGNMWEYMYSEYRRCMSALGDDTEGFMATFSRLRSRRLTLTSIISIPLQELPQIVFTLRAVQYPSSIPLSIASLNLITSSASSFTNTLFRWYLQTGSISDNFASVRKIYETMNLQNHIPDGTVPYPENQQSLKTGLSIEFKNVYFKYPQSDKYALNNVSFKIGKGQLCVILGQNGSGKSTILKLITRLYEPEKGEIFVDGFEIKTLKLRDIRSVMAVLFQDYTHFPLSIGENIALGDPGHSDDLERIVEAATLGGASEFIDKLSDGYDTYLDRPVMDHYSGLPEGTTDLFGRPVSFARIRGMGDMKSNGSSSLSGGQMQRIALSRTFMRSLTSESASVGLLLFDEPSASLDPTAEHDLFERLRRLRGQKTMIFSSHRFGNLTRNADIILYMHDSVIVEEGSHNELINIGGEYAKIWNLQAQAFL